MTNSRTGRSRSKLHSFEPLTAARTVALVLLVGATSLASCGDETPVFLIDDAPGTADAGDAATDGGNDATDTGNDAADTGNDAADSGDDATDSGDVATDSGDDASDTGDDATDAEEDATDGGEDAPDASPDVEPVCGDGVVEGAEACDDGNTEDEPMCEYGERVCDGCSSDCSTPLSLRGPFCGDSMRDEEFEECDGDPGVECTDLGLVGDTACVRCRVDSGDCREPEVFELLNDGFSPGDSVGFQGGFLPGEVAVACFDPGTATVVVDVELLIGASEVGELVSVPIHVFLRDEDGTPTGDPVFSEAFDVVSSHELLTLEFSDGPLVDGAFCIGVEATLGGLPFVARDTDDSIDRSENWVLLPPSWFFQSWEVGLEGDWVIRATAIER